MSNIIDTDSKIIVADQFGFGQPALCRCSSTLMFAAHINDSSQLEIHRSIDDGVNWSLVKTFTETDIGDFEFATIDETSAAITFSHGNYFSYYVTTDSGTTWTLKLQSSDQDVPPKCNIAYDSVENRLWIVYYAGLGGNRIALRYTDDKGETETYKEYITGLLNYYVTDIDINPINSKVYIVITKSGSAMGKRYIFSKTGDYESISDIGNTEHYDTCIVIDSEGNDCIITGYKHSDNKYYIAYAKNGVLETTNFLLGPADTYADLIIPGSLSCAVDGDDNIYAFYTKVSDEKCYYRKYNGSTWESEVELISEPNDRISTEKRPIPGSSKLHFVYYKSP